MRRISDSYVEDLAGDFEMLKISVLLKCQQINKDVHDVTLGPNSVKHASRKGIFKLKPSVTQQTKHVTLVDKKSEREPSQKLTTSRNVASIVHKKAIAEIESHRLEEVQDKIEKRRQEFLRFSRNQSLERKSQWQKQQENMILAMQQKENYIKQVLDQHERDANVKNKEIEHYYRQQVDARIKQERDLYETKKLVKSIVEAVSKYQLEFKAIHNEIAKEVFGIDVEQRNNFANHVTTLDQLREQLEGIVAKCKTSPFQLRQSDQTKCGEVVDLANRIKRQVKEAAAKIREPVHKPPTPPITVPQPIITIPQPLISIPQPPPISTPQPPPPVVIKTPPPPPTYIQSTETEPIQEPVEAVPKLEKYISKSSLGIYTALENNLLQKEQSYKQIEEDPSLKRFKSDCKKIVNTPVNTISDATSSHILDKYKKLHNVLSGRPVEISGDRITSSQHMHGVNFCMDLLAKKFVLQGDLIVSCTSESAFNYATVIVSLWNDFPAFGHLILGHFHRECPYLVPFYPPKVPGQSEEDFFRSQGYHYNDGLIEEQDKFLKRMTGYMRLYAAIFITNPKRSQNGACPHSMAVAWRWLASMLNLEPRMDITATMIYTFLEFAGSKMQAAFGSQFTKLVRFLSTEYMTKIKSIDSGGPVTRLDLLLQNYAKNGGFQEPDGMLPDNFW